MLAPTHGLFGIFLTLIILALFGIKWSLHWTVLAFAVIGALVPDIDHTKSIIGKFFPAISKRLEEKYGHRTITHSIWGWAVSTLILGLILIVLHFVGFKAWSSGIINWRWIAAFSIGYISHLLIDMVNFRGVPLLWPEKIRFVVFKNPKMRVESGARLETVFVLVLVILVFLALPLSKYGLLSSLRWMLATSGSAIEEYKASNTVSMVEFSGYFTATKQPVEKGLAEMLDVQNKRLIVLYKGNVYTLSDELAADIIADKVRAKTTNVPLTIERKDFTNLTRAFLESQIPAGGLISGAVKLPPGLKLNLPDFTGGYARLEQKGDDLVLNFADKKLVKGLELTEEFKLELEKDRTELSNLLLAQEITLSKIRQLEGEEGLTPLGETLLLSGEKAEKRRQEIAELNSKLAEINLKIKDVRLRIKSRQLLFSGTVYIRHKEAKVK